MSLIDSIAYFLIRHGFVLELAVCIAATTWGMEHRANFGQRCAAILLVAFVFTENMGHLPSNVYTESVRTFLLWTIAALGVWLCFKIPFSWAVFYATASGTMQHIIFRGARLMQNLIYVLSRYRATWAWGYAYVPLFAVLYILCYFMFSRRLQRPNLGPLPGRTMLLVTAGFQLLLNLFVNLFNYYGSFYGASLFTLYSAFDLVVTVLLFFMLCEMMERSSAERDNTILQQMMRQQRQQLELSRESMELINIKCHDIRKQLYTLGDKVPAEELDELKNAVRIYDTTVRTGCEPLDVLLAERSVICQSRSIQLDYMVDGAKLCFLKPGEIYSLFGNALDNAIEAVTQLPEDKRYIGLQVREDRGMLLIRMENYMAGSPKFVNGLPQTTKGDPDWHGFGVKSIRRIVEQYGGTLRLQAQDGMFCVIAVLPLTEHFKASK